MIKWILGNPYIAGGIAVIIVSALSYVAFVIQDDTAKAAEVTSLRGQVAGLQAAARANAAGWATIEHNAGPAREIYHETIREVASVPPIAPNCLTDPAWVAALNGMRGMRDAYISASGRQSTDPVQGPANQQSPGSSGAGHSVSSN